MIHRNATAQDLPAIVGIYNATIAGRMVTADTDPVTVESRLEWFAAHDPRRHPIWVVEIDGHLAAWLSFSPFHDRPAYRHTAEVGLYIGDAFRGRGVGSALLKSAIAESPALDLTTLVGLIFGHNEPSLSLFDRLGFRRWGLLPRVATLDGVERDLVIMGRRVA